MAQGLCALFEASRRRRDPRRRRQIYAGCNVENAAYPDGNCAEASAIAAMIAGGGKRIAEIAVIAGRGKAPVTPCGGCRQRIPEFAGPDTVLYLCDDAGVRRDRHAWATCCPTSFRAEHRCK